MTRDVSFCGFRYRRVGQLAILTALGLILYRRCGSLHSFRWMREAQA